MDSSELDKEILRQLFDLINIIVFLEKKTIYKIREISLYPTEIHLLLHLQNKSRTNITQIAESLGVTKGAVSQTLTRLEKKGVVTKHKDPYSKNELSVDFSDLGREVLKEYGQNARKLHGEYLAYLSNLDNHEKEAVLGFLRHAAGLTSQL